MPATAVQAIPDAIAPVIAAVMQDHPGVSPELLGRLVVHELRDLGWHITAKPTVRRPASSGAIMTRPRCGLDPRAQLTDDDRQAVAEFRAYLADRTALRDRIAQALEDASYRPDIRRSLQLADAVLAVLPPPVSPADVPPLTEVWVVWREEEPAYGYFATEDAAKQATIDCWEEDEPKCPDYSWRRDGPRWELVVGGEHGGVYASRHRVYGAPVPPPVDRSAVLREAADAVAAHPGPIPYRPQLDEDGGFWWDTRDRDAIVALLRRMADETATETPSTRLARQSVQAMADTLQQACPPGCVACATDESHDPAPAAGARQDGAQS